MKISPPHNSTFFFTLLYIDVQGIFMTCTLWRVFKKCPSIFLRHLVSNSYSSSLIFTIYGIVFSLVVGSLVLYSTMQGLYIPMESSWSFLVMVFTMIKLIYLYIYALYLVPYSTKLLCFFYQSFIYLQYSFNCVEIWKMVNIKSLKSLYVYPQHHSLLGNM